MIHLAVYTYTTYFEAYRLDTERVEVPGALLQAAAGAVGESGGPVGQRLEPCSVVLGLDDIYYDPI